MWGSSQGLSQDSAGGRLKGRRWDSLVVVVKLSQKVQTLGSLELSVPARRRPRARRRRGQSGIAQACHRAPNNRTALQPAAGRTHQWWPAWVWEARCCSGEFQCSGPRSFPPSNRLQGVAALWRSLLLLCPGLEAKMGSVETCLGARSSEGNGVCTDGSHCPTESAARAGRGWASARAQAGSPRGEAGAGPGGVSPPHACL